MPRDRKKEQREYYAKPEVKEYHRKWIRAYWKKIKSDPVAHAKWKAQGVKNSRAAYQREKEFEKAEWRKMMESDKSRLAMFVVLMQMVRGKLEIPLTSGENNARKYNRERLKKIRATPEGRLKYIKIQKRHHPKSLITRREGLQHRRLIDVTFRIVAALRGRLSSALRASKSKKSDRSMKLFGCGTGAELRAILESKFKPGMSWKNYGKEWVVDHVRPCASFDLSIPEQQSECFHHSNLEPKFGGDNRKKSSVWNGRRWLHSDHRKEITA